jgi:pimeloyl-ACP methyl ester carboxylesterase
LKIVLVHGSYHGAWCWSMMEPELARLGHEVTAVELPIGDTAAGASAYAATIIEQVDWAEPPMLVGHSTAGLILPTVAERRPVRQMVFVGAFLPRPGMSANDQRRDEPIDPPVVPTTSEWTDLGDDVWMVGPNTAHELFFHDASPEVSAWAIAQLRPQSYRVMNEITPLTAWPDVRSDYIVCRDDRAMNPAWGRSAATDRLGVTAIEMEGSHSPFLTRPAELAALLDRLAR